MSNKPKKANYIHYQFDKFMHSFSPKLSEVEVIDEDDQGKFKIKLLTSDIKNHQKGDVMWVDKSKIIFPIK